MQIYVFQFYTSTRKAIRRQPFVIVIRESIYGVFVVSGGMVLAVSLTAVSVTAGVIDVESNSVLSEDPDTFFVELHAEAANNIEPAKARLKIVFFIMSSICSG